MEVALTRETVMLTTKLGEAFHGNIMPKKITFSKTRTSNDDMVSPKEKSKHDGNKSSFNQFINRDECVLIKLKRLSNIHRAVDICCDIKGNNFAVLQVNFLIHLISFNYSHSNFKYSHQTNFHTETELKELYNIYLFVFIYNF